MRGFGEAGTGAVTLENKEVTARRMSGRRRDRRARDFSLHQNENQKTPREGREVFWRVSHFDFCGLKESLPRSREKSRRTRGVIPMEISDGSPTAWKPLLAVSSVRGAMKSAAVLSPG